MIETTHLIQILTTLIAATVTEIVRAAIAHALGRRPKQNAWRGRWRGPRIPRHRRRRR